MKMERKRSVRLRDLLLGYVEPEQPDLELAGLALDCRQLSPHFGFVAVAGRSRHGMDFLDQAIAAGANVVIHDGAQPVPDNCPIVALEVRQLDQRLPELARRMWGDPAGMDLIAVTGTNGKSSVAWLLAQALDGAMIGTLGVGKPGEHSSNSLTTPDVLSVHRMLADLRDNGIDSVVLEASSHALDQQRLTGLSFTSTIFTTLGHDHLDYHGDQAAYGAAKARLFTEFESRRRIINLDDAFGARLADSIKADVIGYGTTVGESIDVSGRLLEALPEGLRVEIEIRGEAFTVQSRLLGRINIYNLLVVAAELSARGRDCAEIAMHLAALEPVPGRMQPVVAANGRAVIVDYAHTPDALENALNSLREITRENLWCVFGCGGERDTGKRARMGRIAESLADRVVITNDNPRHESPLAIIRQIQSGMRQPQRSQVIADRAAAIRFALSSALHGDVVLIAGKGHETEQVIGDERQPFSDEAVVREILEAAA
jgi:UDP-N-acetylmuramoyl-L-alanyl-D-glutamate--2,6-diaminopimelate ligase